MSASGTHRDLLVWQEAMALVQDVYQATGKFPKEEAYGLVTQLRRSAISVPSNIAEGAGRNTAGELAQFLGIASGSLAELDTQIELAIRLGFIKPETQLLARANRVGKLLTGLRKSLRNPPKRS